MIKYSLVCNKQHAFESWFPDSRSFDRLAKGGLLVCPDCNSSRVSKALMAPAVVASKKKALKPRAEAPPANDAPPVNVAMIDEGQKRLRELAKELRQEIMAKTDDVGARFPEEARAIHAGDAPQRSIRGQATMDEARALIEEGVGVLPIPSVPEDFN
jgi:hypothetical protein